MGFLADKKILITGLLSKHSIAYGIARACHREGAQLAFTYQNERFEERVDEAASTFGSNIVLPCDVASDAEIGALFDALAAHQFTALFGGGHQLGRASRRHHPGRMRIEGQHARPPAVALSDRRHAPRGRALAHGTPPDDVEAPRVTCAYRGMRNPMGSPTPTPVGRRSAFRRVATAAWVVHARERLACALRYVLQKPSRGTRSDRQVSAPSPL